MPEYAGWCDNNKPGFRSYEVCTRGICELANYSAYGAGGGRNLSNASTLRELGLYCQDDDAAVAGAFAVLSPARNCSSAVPYLASLGIGCRVDISSAITGLSADGTLASACPNACGVCPVRHSDTAWANGSYAALWARAHEEGG